MVDLANMIGCNNIMIMLKQYTNAKSVQKIAKVFAKFSKFLQHFYIAIAAFILFYCTCSDGLRGSTLEALQLCTLLIYHRH